MLEVVEGFEGLDGAIMGLLCLGARPYQLGSGLASTSVAISWYEVCMICFTWKLSVIDKNLTLSLASFDTFKLRLEKAALRLYRS